MKKQNRSDFGEEFFRGKEKTTQNPEVNVCSVCLKHSKDSCDCVEKETESLKRRQNRGEDPLEKGMATHSSILAWRIPWTEECGGLQSTGLQRVGHN